MSNVCGSGKQVTTCQLWGVYGIFQLWRKSRYLPMFLLCYDSWIPAFHVSQFRFSFYNLHWYMVKIAGQAPFGPYVTILSWASRILCSFFVYSGVITKSAFHFYMSFISQQRTLVWRSLFHAGFYCCFLLQRSQNTCAKHNMKNAGKYHAETTEDSLSSNMTFCSLTTRVDGDWKSHFHFSE